MLELDATVDQEALEYVAARYGILNSFVEFAFSRHPRRVACQQTTAAELF